MHTTRSQGSGSHLNGAGHRRPQTLMSPGGIDRKIPTDLTLTIKKDCNGYGMKVHLFYARFIFFLFQVFSITFIVYNIF